MENPFQNDSRDSESTQLISSGASATFEPGKILLDKFRVVEHLGAGGMGNVYRVDHLLLEKPFAFKCLNKFQEADASWKRFQNEAKAAQLLDHPNLLKVFEFGLLESGQPFFLMELVEGKTLADEIKRLGHLPTQRAVSLFIQVAFAIACAHDQKIVHRDLKPSNIMIVPPKSEHERETVKVVDFGIAKLTGVDEFNQQTLTKTGEIFGSPFYMSPEQCTGLPVDYRSDLYSLGCVFFETLTSAPPFMGESALSTMMKHQSEKPMSLKEASLGQNYPPALEQIVGKLLEKNPERRYQSAHLLARDLIALERDLAEHGAGGALEKIDTANFRIKAPLVKPEVSKDFRNVIQLVAVGAIMYVLGVGSTILYFKNTAPPPAPSPSPSPSPSPTKVKLNFPHYWSEEQNGKKIFNFPEFAVGTLIAPNNGRNPATGRIVIAASDKIGLIIDNEMDKDPSLLARFRPDDLVVLDYKGLKGSSSIYTLFNNLTGLRCLNVSGTTFGDKDLHILQYLKNLIYLNLSTCDVDCTELAKHKEIYNLQHLDISHLNRPEDVLKLLPNFKNLKHLALATNALGDADLAYVGRNKTIRVLNLSHNLITDKGIEHISNMQSLEWLDISNCNVTPKCIKSLIKLKNLRMLEIVPSTWKTEEVNAFVRELNHNNPNVKIHYSNEITLDPTVLLPFKWDRIGLLTHTNIERFSPPETQGVDSPRH